jgi:hypothetical protein
LKVPVPAHRLEMWPGFLTSMRQQESGVMLNVDMTMKVMRTDTVLQMMEEIRRPNQNTYQQECASRVRRTPDMENSRLTVPNILRLYILK